MAGEILRLEMRPLGVRVLTVNSGLVKSNLTRNSPELKLPPDSFYRLVERDIAGRARMEDVAKSGTEAGIHAESVVRDVLSGMDGATWRGAFAGTLRYCRIFFPRFLLVSLPFCKRRPVV